MPRLTKDQWDQMRIDWENDPAITITNIAGKYQICTSSVSRRASKEGWVKRGQIGGINEAAHRRADNLLDSNGKPVPYSTADALAAKELSETVRTEVLVRHRKEWAELEELRRTALVAMRRAHEESKYSAWAMAKSAADTALSNIKALNTKQAGECRAWGLDQKLQEDIVIVNPRVDD